MKFFCFPIIIFFIKTIELTNANYLETLHNFLLRIHVVNKYTEDALLNTDTLLQKYGYTVEKHYVTTEDGYILQMHRISHSKDKSIAGEKGPVLMEHGIYASSSDWILNGPEKGLAYALADAGYDVWLGNARGNLYSLNHTTLEPTPNNKQYWDFSWHELGVYDLPACIDYILEETRQDDLIYIGHSQGTTIFHVLLSERPEYNSKIKIGLMLAPIGFISPIVPGQKLFLGLAAKILMRLNINFVGPYYHKSNILLLETVCNLKFIGPQLCFSILFLGHNRADVDVNVPNVFYGHWMAGAAVKQIIHYAQGIHSGHFRQYDYGATKNLQHYSSKSPPDYHLANIKTKVYMLYSKHDLLSEVKDVEKLCSMIQDCTKVLIADGKYHHVDYLVAKNADKLVNRKILHILDNEI